MLNNRTLFYSNRNSYTILPRTDREYIVTHVSDTVKLPVPGGVPCQPGHGLPALVRPRDCHPTPPAVYSVTRTDTADVSRDEHRQVSLDLNELCAGAPPGVGHAEQVKSLLIRHVAG
jgi:hypothetical protein